MELIVTPTAPDALDTMPFVPLSTASGNNIGSLDFWCNACHETRTNEGGIEIWRGRYESSMSGM